MTTSTKNKAETNLEKGRNELRFEATVILELQNYLDRKIKLYTLIMKKTTTPEKLELMKMQKKIFLKIWSRLFDRYTAIMLVIN